MTKIRIRGIYTTALTNLFTDSGFEVVQSSPTIRRRFDESFGYGEYDVVVHTSDDRQGVSISGNPEKVEEAVNLLSDIAIDTLSWGSKPSRGAIYNAIVDDTAKGGAILSLANDEEGYLPFSNANTRVGVGDNLRVQVVEPSPPWSSRKPVLDTDIRVFGGVADLVWGTSVSKRLDKETRLELERITEMLGTDIPDGWNLRWGYDATDIDMEALEASLEKAVEGAKSIDDDLETSPEPQDNAPHLVSSLEETNWVWFGRETRFTLDQERNKVVYTLPGHHRIKVGSDEASKAVDFAENLLSSRVQEEDFDFGTVTGVFGPTEGDTVSINHGKPSGKLIKLGKGEVVERDVENQKVVVVRDLSGRGDYDELEAEKEEGDTATTKFKEGRWWYPTVYEGGDGTRKGTYINVCTPVEVFPDSVRYVDLHVDVVKHSNGTVERVDDGELDEAVERNEVPDELAEKARDVASTIVRAIGE